LRYYLIYPINLYILYHCVVELQSFEDAQTWWGAALACTRRSLINYVIDEAIEALERGGEGEEIGYVGIAKKFGVDESTLRRRHQGKCNTRVEAAQERKDLSTQQEEELVKYIKDLTSKGLPCTRAMIQNFASVVAKKEVGKSWVLRFLNRHKDTL
jgi:hypothetical protein